MLIGLKKIGKRKYKQSFSFIPCLFTFLNAIFGFLSIVKSVEGNYKAAAAYILVAAICDGFDGRLARAFGSTSYFGMELDSLCDAISFCLAPAILLYCWIPLETLIGKTVLAFYLCAGLGRLARFNVHTDEHISNFIGLPTTLAASFIASLVLADQWFLVHGINILNHKYMVLVLICSIAFLMISSVPFASHKQFKLAKRRDYYIATSFCFLLAVLIVGRYPLFLCLTSCYILSNLARYVTRHRIR